MEIRLEPPGPRPFRTDVRYMSRRDLFASSRQFLLASVLGLVLAISLGLLALRDPRQIPRFAVFVGLLALVVLSLAVLALAAYLCVRAFRRNPAYDPREVWAGDLLGVDLAGQEEARE